MEYKKLPPKGPEMMPFLCWQIWDDPFPFKIHKVVFSALPNPSTSLSDTWIMWIVHFFIPWLSREYKHNPILYEWS